MSSDLLIFSEINFKSNHSPQLKSDFIFFIFPNIFWSYQKFIRSDAALTRAVTRVGRFSRIWTIGYRMLFPQTRALFLFERILINRYFVPEIVLNIARSDLISDFLVTFTFRLVRWSNWFPLIFRIHQLQQFQQIREFLTTRKRPFRNSNFRFFEPKFEYFWREEKSNKRTKPMNQKAKTEKNREICNLSNWANHEK